MDGEGSAPEWRLYLLGRFELEHRGCTVISRDFPRRKSQAILKLLALQPGRRMHRDQLVDALWPDLPPAAARKNLHKALHYLRKAIERFNPLPLVELRTDVVTLSRDVWCDLDLLLSPAAAARDIDALAYAVESCAGDLLPDDVYEPWTEPHRGRAHAAWTRAALDLASCYDRGSQPGRALDVAQRVLDVDATQEEAHRCVIRQRIATGAHAEAMRQYARCRDVLRHELGIEPSPETTALVQRLAALDAAAPLPPAVGEDDGPRAFHAASIRASEDFVGRSMELQRLIQSFAESAERFPGIVLVSGDPGIGKTRLLEELGRFALARGAVVAWGRCEPSLAAPAYWPWIQVLRELDDPLSDGAAGSAGLLSPAASPNVDVSALRDSDRTRGRFRLHDAIASALRRVARTRPMVLMFDDLHEADEASLELLLHLARHARGSNMLIVCAMRDVARDSNSVLSETLGELSREHLKAHLALAGLNRDEVREFVQRTLGVTPPDGSVSLLHRQTEGNPFFLRECVLMLEPDMRQGRVTARLAVPPSVGQAVAHRLERLEGSCRELLRAAAVAGQRFDARLVARAAHLRPASVAIALEEAVSQRIIRASDEGHGATLHEFCHGIIQQVLYEALPLLTRAALHRRVAQEIEGSTEAQAQLAQLAHHYAAAARVDGDTARAVEYARRAGAAAIQVFAWESARQHWETARELLEIEGSREALAEVLEDLHTVILNIGDELERAVEYMERAIGIREELGEARAAAEDHSRLGIALSVHVGDPTYAQITNLDRALEHYRAAEPVIGSGGDAAPVALFHVGLATVAFSGLRVPQGLASSARAMEIAERLNMRPVWASAALLRGGVLKLAGRLAESRTLFREAYDAADESNDMRVAFYAATNLADWTEGFDAGDGALLESELARPRNASANAHRATVINDIACGHARNGRLGEARRRLADVPGGFLQSMLDFYDGNWERCLASLNSGLDILRSSGNRSSLANRLDHLAALHVAMDDFSAARAALDEELALAVEGEAALIELRARSELASLLALASRHEDAAEHLRRCEEIVSNGEDWGRKHGRFLLALAVADASRAMSERAERRLDEAIAIFNARTLPWDEADAHVQYARALELSAMSDEAAPHRRAAAEIYARIGAGPRWITRAQLPMEAPATQSANG